MNLDAGACVLHPRQRSRIARCALAAVSTLLLAVSLVLGYPDYAHAKSYEMPDVSISARVAPDGDLAVTEQRSFDFDGDFTRVYWVFDASGTEGYDIVGVRQIEPVEREYLRTDDPATLTSRPDGYFLVQDRGSALGGEVEVDVFHRSEDERATWVVEYEIKGIAKRYSDTAELYWQAIGAEWSEPTGRARVEIEPPEPLAREQVRAWAHGPLTGTVSIAEDGTVVLEVEDVPANQFVEARVLYPTGTLSTAPTSGEPREEAVLAEEGALAREANLQRLLARAWIGAVVGIPWLLAIAGLVVALAAFLRYGREHEAEFRGQYYREDPRPDLHPAVIGALWRFGVVHDTDVAATLMNLADNGVIRMRSSREHHRESTSGREDTAPGDSAQPEAARGNSTAFVIERLPEAEAGVSELDRELLSLLFDRVGEGRHTIALDEIPAYAEKDPDGFTQAVRSWKSSAIAEAEALGLFESEGRAQQVRIVLWAGAIGLVALIAAFAGQTGWSLLLPVPAVALMIGLVFAMERRSKAGNELYRKYAALRNFLRDFSHLDEAPPASVVLWNRFLVLAVIFGIAEEVIEQLRVVLPEIVRDTGFHTTYEWVQAPEPSWASPAESFTSSFASASEVAFSRMSSASGEGGGFSSDSGGGGGSFSSDSGGGGAGGGGGGAD